MTDKLSLHCVIEGESSSKAFEVTVDCDTTIDGVKQAIFSGVQAPAFKGIAAKDLTLWRVSIPNPPNKGKPFFVSKSDSPSSNATCPPSSVFVKGEMDSQVVLDFNQHHYFVTELDPSDDVDVYDTQQPPKKTIHIIIELLTQDEILKRDLEQGNDLMPKSKGVRMTEERWQTYLATDGNSVNLPPDLIAVLQGQEFTPAPRTVFNLLKNDLDVGKAIHMPSLGQVPKHFKRVRQHYDLFVTEQMLNLWQDMQNKDGGTYRRILAGPMGIGKSYLSYFLAAKAYAAGWIVLYISNAGDLDKKFEAPTEMEIVKRFLAINKDILTAADLEKLVIDYKGEGSISSYAVLAIFGVLLKQVERPALLLVDEHGKLFEKQSHLLDEFRTLAPLKDFSLWGEEFGGLRVIFTGASHAKYEMKILEDSYRSESVVFIDPLSEVVFLKLLGTYELLNQPGIKDKIITTTNCVPRELRRLASRVQNVQDPISVDYIREYETIREQDLFALPKITT